MAGFPLISSLSMTAQDPWGWLRPLATPTLTLRQGELLFWRGDRISSVYLLEQGRVNLARTLEDGSAIVLASFGSKELAGEASLFSTRYHCDAVAVGPVQLLRVPKKDVIKALRSCPDAAMTLLECMAHAIQSSRLATELRNIRPLSARLLSWLELQPLDMDGWVRSAGSWKDVAQLLGISHEALYRILARLEVDKRIEREPGRVLRLPVSSHMTAVIR